MENCETSKEACTSFLQMKTSRAHMISHSRDGARLILMFPREIDSFHVAA